MNKYPDGPEPGLTPVAENTYRADLELLDRYVKFSAEIARLSLLGIAGIGFYVKEIVVGGNHVPPTWFSILLGATAVGLAASAACALLHRYFATDGIFYHLKAVRLNLGAPDSAAASRSAIAKSSSKRNLQYAVAGDWLNISQHLLAVSAAVGAWAFAAYLWFDKSGLGQGATLGLVGGVALALGWAFPLVRAFRRLLGRRRRGNAQVPTASGTAADTKPLALKGSAPVPGPDRNFDPAAAEVPKKLPT